MTEQPGETNEAESNPPRGVPLRRVLHFPDIEIWNERVLDSPIRRLGRPAAAASGVVEPFHLRTVQGSRFTPDSGTSLSGPVLVVPKVTAASGLLDLLLLTPNGALPETGSSGCRWLRPRPSATPADPAMCEAECRGIIESWRGCFRFKAEQREGDEVTERGLRPPQIGALYAALAHWTVSHEPATIVMPTGTGKTETMLGLLVEQRLARLLVIVPTDALRDQVAAKFLSFGVLGAAGVVQPGALLPVVGVLRHKPKSVEETDTFFRRCNVVVTTAQIAGQCTEDVSRRIAVLCSHLFVDEAHHVPAQSWSRVRASFAGKPVLQFTATPYRGDGKLVDGRVIYNYPLRKAQTDGYFRPIRFRPVEEYAEDRSDERIARVALSQLDEDLAAGRDHLLMARCSSIARAEVLHELYRRLAASHNPVLAHSDLKGEEKRDAVARLRTRRARVVVCVDMFGEGFDLPELKIAALHDVHKSLAVTLQFTGRFTRTQANVGDATIVANIADAEVEDALQALYGEDPDWNHLLRDLTEEATGGHALRSEFLQGFSELPERIPLQNLFPKMSTVVFETQCTAWNPKRVEDVVKHIYDRPALHARQQVLVFVTREQQPVEWGNVRGLCDTIHDLYILHWDKGTGLLYIHSSNKNSVHEELARAVCGGDTKIVRGERVFRALHGVNRLILTNLGLGHSLSRAVRFTMHVGADIREGLSEAHAQNKYKTNLFGRGYAGGDRASIGCSIKGRLWSFQAARDIGEWVDWCHETGRKLGDGTIDVGAVLRGAMVPRTVADRPADKVPLTIEWSEDLLARSEEAVQFELAGLQAPFYDVGLELAGQREDGPIRFRVTAGKWPRAAEYEVRFSTDRAEYVPLEGTDLSVAIGKRKRPLSEYLQDEPPVIRFHDGAFLIYNDLFEAPSGPRTPFDASRIETWNWTGIDLKKESQTETKLADSIQRRVIETVLAERGADHFDVVFDDDAAGEAADVVALRVESDRLLVRLYHCKYSQEALPGHRVKDLYEVCGQAQRSVYWKGQPEDLIDHLLSRESARQRRGGVSRFERGDVRALRQIRGRMRTLTTEFQIFVVQPGLSKAVAEAAQLDLLAVTELYLKETYGAALRVIASG